MPRPHRSRSEERRYRGSILLLLAGHILKLAAYVTFIYYTTFLEGANPQPYHTSALTGRAWISELLDGHPNRIKTELGVHKHVFQILIEELKWLGVSNSRHVDLEEKLGIFLYSCTTALSVRHIGERFQRSNETISMYMKNLRENNHHLITSDHSYFKEVLDAFCQPDFYNQYVVPPEHDDPVPAWILNSPLYYPFFKDAIGAIDGTHISCWPSKLERDLARDRKGNISHNTLCSCGFDMKFQHCTTGHDGSTADTTMFAQARMQDRRIPDGKYLLADAGFQMCDGLLVPYSGVRYHLQEWERSELQYVPTLFVYNLYTYNVL